MIHRAGWDRAFRGSDAELAINILYHILLEELPVADEPTATRLVQASST